MLNHSEKVAVIAAGLYDARRACVSILGESKFREKVEAFRPLFSQVVKETKCTELQAMQAILKTCDGDAIKMHQVIGICTEIMEPSLKPAQEVSGGD